MLTPPDDLTETDLVTAVAGGWGITAASMSYRPVGFGSHHWEITDPGGARWFVTADELEHKRHHSGEPLGTAFGRLRGSLAAARSLREHGRAFVVAPVPALNGEPLVRVAERFGVALYPYVEGESFVWGEFPNQAHRRAVLDLIVGVHTAPRAVCGQAPADDFAVPHRDDLQAALDGAAGADDWGPYARCTADLLAEYGAPIRRLLDRYDELAEQGRTQPTRSVLTHGESHPGNTMRTAKGWLLIDWDTALVAPPERDLWNLDPGDGSVLRAYTDATGVSPLPAMLQLYRIRWNLADIAVEVARFRRPHGGTPNDDASWQVLRSVVAHIST